MSDEREMVLMEKFLAGYSAQAYAVMRIVVASVFFCHGLQKVFGLFGGVKGAAVPLVSLLGVAGVIEIITGALIVVGFAHGHDGVYRQRRDGRGLLYRPFPRWVLADSKRRRTRRALLLHISLRGNPRRGNLEHRWRTKGRRLAIGWLRMGLPSTLD
jgi:hypothetical protein